MLNVYLDILTMSELEKKGDTVLYLKNKRLLSLIMHTHTHCSYLFIFFLIMTFFKVVPSLQMKISFQVLIPLLINFDFL